MTLEEAQAALVVAQQELSSASAALQLANSSVSAATIVRDDAQASYSSASAAWEATKVTVSGTTTTTTQNVVQNGTFDSTANWSNVVASNTVYGTGASPLIYNGTLKGSYTAGIYIQQTGTFPSPTRQVTFAVDVWNYDTNEGNRINNPDYYRIEFRTYNAAGTRLNYYNLEWSQWHEWLTRGATYNLSDDAVRWDVGFRLQDSGYWAGAFGPVMDNVRVIATMTQSTPDTYNYGEEETQAKNSAQQDLQAAQAALDSAVLAQAAATSRLDAAIDEVVRLTNLVEDLTPRLTAPTNLTLNVTESGVELSWTAPVPNLSGVMPERYAVMWSTTNFADNGWGIASTTTSITIPTSTLFSTAPQGSTFQFAIRSDNDTLALYSGQSNIVSLVTVAPPWWQVQFWEGETVTISAPEGYKFGVPTAWYGSPTDSNCGATVSEIVNEIINGRTTATFSADNGLFGDPCGGVVKVLRMSTPITPVVVTPPVVVSPTPTPSPEPQPEPQPTPSETPRPTPSPEPETLPVPVDPTPTQSPEPEPSPTIDPEPTPTEQPEPEITEPSQPLPTPEPSPEETGPNPIVDPEPAPTQTPETPSEKPKPIVPEEKPVKVEIEEEISAENIENLVEELSEITPQELTAEQQEMIKEAAIEVFASAEQGSAEYEAALDALLVVAQADDIVLDEELAAIPLIGNVAGAAVEVFNALGNAGADMSPQVREQSEKVVIAAVIVGQVAMTATAAATSAAAAAARRP